MFATVEPPRDEGDGISDEGNDGGLSLAEFTGFFNEMLNQPSWRARADKEMDYKDGNQLDSELLEKMRKIGMPPAIEPLIGLAIESILGEEAKNRTDWRVIPDGDDQEGEEIAEALNYKLNQAERKAKADRACSDAFESQVSVGVGWVEVARETNPFKYPYRCVAVHRNEIWWDWLAKCPLLSDARYLVRTKWVDKAIAQLMFPDHKDLLNATFSGWNGMDAYTLDGGHSTGLAMAADIERGWSIEEQQWRDVEQARVRLFEVWYRRWVNALVLKLPDGRVVELDRSNDLHMMAVASGIAPQYAVICKVRRAWYAGPHKLSDDPTEYKHDNFPYVPFWGHKEDRTGVPFGRIRPMMFMQDNINASLAKIRWGLAATVTTRTDGAVLADDSHFRQEIARPDADIVLDADHMARPGAMFEINRNFELNEQQYKMLNDARAIIQKVSGVSNEFQGVENSSKSGVQYNSQIEQARQSLASIMDNFNDSRAQVGQLLLSMIIQDMGESPEDVVIDGGGLRDDRVVHLNQPVSDEFGMAFKTNDVQRTLLKVTLNDVPSTPSFRTQQLNAMSEAYKAAPPEFQRIMMPHLMNLLDVPNKDLILQAIKEAERAPDPEQIEAEQKLKELELKILLNDAKIKEVEARAVKIMTDAQYAAMQGGAQVATMPEVAPIADEIMKNAGYRNPDPGGVDPNFPVPGDPPQVDAPQVTQNTSPTHPPVPPSAMSGVETARVNDNL